MKLKVFLGLALGLLLYGNSLKAQDDPANYDESKVPEYTLPPLLETTDGTPVKSVKVWEKKRRPEILHLFEENEYGKMPGKPAGMHFKLREENKHALNGKATRKQVIVYFTKDESGQNGRADLSAQ